MSDDNCSCCGLRCAVGVTAAILMVLSGGLFSVCVILITINESENILKSIMQWMDHMQDLYTQKQHEQYTDGTYLLPDSFGKEPVDVSLWSVILFEWMLLALIIFFFFCFVTNFLLIISAAKKSPVLAIPWMAMLWINIFLLCCLVGVVIWKLLIWNAFPEYWWTLMFIVAMILALLAFFILVLSFYNQCYECDSPVLPQYYDEMQMTHRHIWYPEHSVDYDGQY